jgi:hypothetical protein
MLDQLATVRMEGTGMSENPNPDDAMPGDRATLGEWIAFAKEAYADAPFVAKHLEDLADRDGRNYRVEFSTRDFLFYLDAYRLGHETDRAKGSLPQQGS